MGNWKRLTAKEIIDLLDSDDPASLFVEPLLDRKSQIGTVSLDLRLGYDFLVSMHGRKPFIGAEPASGTSTGADGHFQGTRRDLGDGFILYPNQVVLASSLEYLCLPPDVMGDVVIRSSYARLGIHLNTMLQPGYRGCASLELANHGNNPLQLIVGSRVVQLRLFRLADKHQYVNGEPRKYYGDVRPTVSRFDRDPDLAILDKVSG